MYMIIYGTWNRWLCLEIGHPPHVPKKIAPLNGEHDDQLYSGFQVHLMFRYPLVNKHNYGKWPFIVDFPIENGDFL